MKLVKSITAITIDELAEKINAFSMISPTFATQVFLNNGKYEALCWYEDGRSILK